MPSRSKSGSFNYNTDTRKSRHSYFPSRCPVGCFFAPFTIAYVTIILSHRNLRANWATYIRGVRDSLSSRVTDIGGPSAAKDSQLPLLTGDERWAWIYDAV